MEADEAMEMTNRSKGASSNVRDVRAGDKIAHNEYAPKQTLDVSSDLSQYIHVCNSADHALAEIYFLYSYARIRRKLVGNLGVGRGVLPSWLAEWWTGMNRITSEEEQH